jgi:hypothetical protein
MISDMKLITCNQYIHTKVNLNSLLKTHSELCFVDVHLHQEIKAHYMLSQVTHS